MKKILKVFLLSLCLVISACGKEVSVEQARQALSKHLIERYGEEFEIGYMGRRSDGKDTWYQAEIYPSKFNGTPKQYDKYYKQSGTVNIKKNLFGEEIEYVGDTYRIVLINESANNFYLPKLKELFGENILPIFDIFHYEIEPIPDFKKTIDMAKEKGEAPIIKGGIYIFGRVESDEDREWYREQIFKFLTFMKETGTFEYVSLNIAIIDERILSQEYLKNSELKNALIKKAEDNNLEWEGYRSYRKELYNKNFPKNYHISNTKEELTKIQRTKITEHVGEWSNYNTLLYTKIYSPKYIESQYLKNKKKINYDKVEDIKFGYETW